MGIFGRFFGRRDEDQKDAPAANPALERPISLQLLFPTLPTFDTVSLTRTLRAYHPSMSSGSFEVENATARQGTPVGLAAWGDHVVRIVGFNVPMPDWAVEQCIQPAHYGQDLKAAGRKCKGHAILYYGGRNESAVEQYVSLAAVSGVLAQHGALLVLNESARTSLPAKVFLPGQGKSDQMELLRHFPLLALYCGFVKYNMENRSDVWMRTYGCQLLGLPNLAHLAPGHHAGKETYDLFENMLSYFLKSGAHVAPGHTFEMGDRHLRARSPRADEPFLDDTPGEMLVLETRTDA